MGRTEANEKHCPTELKRGAGGGAHWLKYSNFKMNGR